MTERYEVEDAKRTIIAGIKQGCIPGVCHPVIAGYSIWNACVIVDVTPEERGVLLGRKKRGDSFVLVWLKAEAILYASRGVGTGVIAEMGDRSHRTVPNWLSGRGGGPPGCTRRWPGTPVARTPPSSPAPRRSSSRRP